MNVRQPPRIAEMWHATTDPVRPVDVVIALGLAALSLVAFVSGAPDVGPPGVLTGTLLLLESLPLIVRRRYPLEVFLIVVSATIVHIAALPEGQQLSAGLGVLVALYTVGERLDRRASLPLTVLAGAIVGVLLIVRGGFPAALQSLIQTELILGVAWLVGDTARIRHLYTRALEEQTRLLEREREERARRAVLEERERIARELHDVVAHHVSVIVIQSGGALRAIDTRPADARSALEAIAMTGRQALTDMRRLVGVPGEGEETAPLPRLEQLDVAARGGSFGRPGRRADRRRRSATARPGSRALGLSDHPGGIDQFTETRRRWSDDGYGSLRCGRFGDHDRGRARARFPAGPRAGARGPRTHGNAGAGRDVPGDVRRPTHVDRLSCRRAAPDR